MIIHFLQTYHLVQNMKHKYPLVFGHLTDLLPLWEKEDQHDHDLLKDHDEDVESTLTHPGTALNRLTYVQTLEIQHFKTVVLTQEDPTQQTSKRAPRWLLKSSGVKNVKMLENIISCSSIIINVSFTANEIPQPRMCSSVVNRNKKLVLKLVGWIS